MIDDGNDTPPFRMTLSLNVLNHLGLNLYSNLPAVLSEAVANAWDADATKVSIDIDTAAETIVITDNGLGMTAEEVNSRYLRVGYERRIDNKNPNGARTIKGRAVMGRKGIGKLSLFSIADTIEVRTAALAVPGQPSSGVESTAIRLDISEIRESIRDESGPGAYYPTVIEDEPPKAEVGTEITLRNPRKNLDQTARHLRRRLARRFSMAAEDFEIYLDGALITPEDRDLAKRSRYLWVFGDDEYAATIKEQAPAAVHVSQHTGLTPEGNRVQGWIGAAATSTDLQPSSPEDESLNRVAIMVRGKLAQEDVLEAVAPGGIFVRYLSGEISADFLDSDEDEDIATSSRQGIVEDAPRFQDFRAFLSTEIRQIGTEWSRYREMDGAQDAMDQVPAIGEWIASLKGDTQAAAKSFIAKINTVAADDESRRRLYASGVIAFEQLHRSQRLRALEALDEANLPALIENFNSIDDIESALYYDIVSQRLAVIEKFADLADENALEKVLQEYLFDHLWLLDPGWDRATAPIMEQAVSSIIEAGDQADRVDLKYRTTGSSHVIVELKRAGRRVRTLELLEQIEKYRVPIQAKLRAALGEGVEVEVVCVVGRDLADWSNEGGRERSREALKSYNARVVLYDELVANARASYQQYLDANREVGRIRETIAKIESQLDG